LLLQLALQINTENANSVFVILVIFFVNEFEQLDVDAFLVIFNCHHSVKHLQCQTQYQCRQQENYVN
jgi:hypothetical protein